MQLIRWLRKNNAKIMAVVVVLLMIAFIMPTTLKQLGRYRGAERSVVAYTRDGKITNYDLGDARQELEILKLLHADFLLLSANDLRSMLLSELLFSEQRTLPEVTGRIRRMIKSNQCRISDKQINDIYKRRMGSEIYWLLLKDETERAGIRISNEQSGGFLGRIAPQLFPDATYGQVMQVMMERHGVSEEKILTTFSKLLAVLDYVKMVCSSEDVTISQMMHGASIRNETVDVEFVRFDSAVFTDNQPEPAEQELTEQFNKYKKYSAGAVSEENPYGFGYKLPDRAALEYIAVKLDDVSKTITPPAEEEIEEYYRRNIKRFTVPVPTDPNDPNSPTIDKTKSYAEVANVIAKGLLEEKVNAQAEKILQEAKTHTEAGFEDANADITALTAEQIRKLAGDYKTAADQAGKKYNVKIHTGQTGLLGAVDFQADGVLGLSYIRGHGYNPVRLSKVVFAAGELDAGELGPFDVPEPRLYENIGPTRDMFGKTTTVVRVIKAEKACEPQDINQSYDRKPLRLDDANSTQQAKTDTYSVKENVADDLKKFAAMQTAKNKAEEFIQQAAKDGWENAVDKFNQLYKKEDTTDPNVFKLERRASLQRLSDADLAVVAAQEEGDPAAAFLVNESRKEGLLVAQLYNLVPQDGNTAAAPFAMEFKPDMSYYVIKKLSVNRLNQMDYEIIKAQEAYEQSFVQSQNLAVVCLNPENILKRADFRLAREETAATDLSTEADANAASEPQGASQ